jgi:hypothetical protein
MEPDASFGWQAIESKVLLARRSDEVAKAGWATSR